VVVVVMSGTLRGSNGGEKERFLTPPKYGGFGMTGEGESELQGKIYAHPGKVRAFGHGEAGG
jgi:hypothetical protein